MSGILNCFHCGQEITTAQEYLQRLVKDRNGKIATCAFHLGCLEMFKKQNPSVYVDDGEHEN